MPQQDRREFSRLGEDLAAKFLNRQGYAILGRNYRVRGGEIDLIARLGDTVAFVEVKTRLRHSIRQTLMNVAYTKQKRLSEAARRFLLEHPAEGELRYRFDVILVFHYPDTDSFKIEHYPDAFDFIA